MPTCILMLGVFAAYFITIVIFAGLYLTVNKVGVYYDHSDTTHGGETTELMTEDFALGSGTSGVDEPSFCGMDINNHMEGEDGGNVFSRFHSQMYHYSCYFILIVLQSIIL